MHMLKGCQSTDMACRCVLVACITVVSEHVLCNIAKCTDTHRHRYRQTDNQIDIQTDRETDRQADRQADTGRRMQ